MAQRPFPRMFRRVALVVCLEFAAAALTGAARAGEPVLIATAPMAPYVEALAGRLRDNMPNPPPVETHDGARSAIERFCAAGNGAMVHGLALHRRLNRRERQACLESGIDPTEIALGVEAAVVAVPRESRISRLPLDALFGAVIRDLPAESRFRPNQAQTWRMVDPALPDDPIAVLLPTAPHAARAVLDERGLQGACRRLPAMQAIYAATERTRRCTALRNDDGVREYDGTVALAQALEAAAPGTVAVIPYGLYRRLAPRLLALPVEGVVADDTAIGSESYPLSRRVYLYLRQPDQLRLGAADSHRLAMLADLASNEAAVGPGGAFEAAGLVPLPMAERAAQRIAALQRHAGVRP